MAQTAAKPYLWLLLPLAVLLSAGVGSWQRGRIPTRADWQAATDFVRQGLKPGDGVTWAPYTQGEGRLFFNDLPVFHTRDVSTADLGRYDRLFLMGSLGVDARRLPADDERLDHRTFGEVTVDLVRVGGPKVVGDLMASLERATVRRLYKDGRTQLCDFWSGKGWHCDHRDPPELTRQCLGQSVANRLARKDKDPECGLDPFLHVSRDVRLIGDTPRHCILYHPMANATVQLEWTEAPAGDFLSIDSGFSDPMVADNYKKDLRVKPAALKVLRGGTLLAELPVPAEKGWHHQELPLGGEAAPITFEISTTSTLDAHFCFDPTVRVRTRPAADPASEAAK